MSTPSAATASPSDTKIGEAASEARSAFGSTTVTLASTLSAASGSSGVARRPGESDQAGSL